MYIFYDGNGLVVKTSFAVDCSRFTWNLFVDEVTVTAKLFVALAFRILLFVLRLCSAGLFTAVSGCLRNHGPNNSARDREDECSSLILFAYLFVCA